MRRYQIEDPPHQEDGRERHEAIALLFAGFFILLVAALVSMCGQGCLPVDARNTSNAVAIAANESLPIIVTGWTQQAERCVAEAADREAADRCIAEVDRVWMPMFMAHDVLKAAHDVYREKVAAGEDPSVHDLQPAYCSLRKAIAQLYPLPDFALEPCATPRDAGADAKVSP